MAGLNFVGNAAYADIIDTKENVAQFEFIPWILSQCASDFLVVSRRCRFDVIVTATGNYI